MKTISRKRISERIVPLLILGALFRPLVAPRNRRCASIFFLIWGLTGGLGTSALGRTTNSTFDAAPANRPESSKWVASGLDEDGAPWLRSNRGLEGCYRLLSAHTTRLDLSRIDGTGHHGLVRLGTIEMGQDLSHSTTASGIFFTWRAHSGSQLTVASRPIHTGERQIEIEFRSGETQRTQRAVLIPKPGMGPDRDHQDIQKAEALLAQAAAQPDLRYLAQESLPFLSGEALRLLPDWRAMGTPALALEGGVSDCAYHVTDCLVAMVGYGAGMSALIGSCGFTFGWGCAGALVAHPILAGATAIYCGRAGYTCSH